MEMPKVGYILLIKSGRGCDGTKNCHGEITTLISKYWWTSMIWKLLCIPPEFGLRARRQMEDKWSQWQSRLLVVNPGLPRAIGVRREVLHSLSPKADTTSGRDC